MSIVMFWGRVRRMAVSDVLASLQCLPWPTVLVSAFLAPCAGRRWRRRRARDRRMPLAGRRATLATSDDALARSSLMPVITDTGHH